MLKASEECSYGNLAGCSGVLLGPEHGWSLGALGLLGTLVQNTRHLWRARAVEIEHRRYEIVIEGPAPQWTGEFDDLRAESGSDGQTVLVLRGSDRNQVQPIIDRLRSASQTIHSIKPVRESLEDLFMRAVTDPETGKILAPGAASSKKPTLESSSP